MTDSKEIQVPAVPIAASNGTNAGGALLVRIRTPSGFPVQNAEVSFEGAGHGGQANTGSDGTCRFTDLTADTYTVRAWKLGFSNSNRTSSPAQTTAQVFKGGRTDCELTLVPHERIGVLFVDIEHRHMQAADAPYKENHKNSIVASAREVVPSATGRCIWYPHLSAQLVNSPEILALVVGGSVSQWSWYDDPEAIGPSNQRVGETPSLADLKRLLVSGTSVPILGICGGHQLVAKAFTGHDNAVDHVDYRSKKMDIDTENNGVTVPMLLTPEGRRDRIFNNLQPSPQFREYHHDEVNLLAPGTRVLADTIFSHNQALRYTVGNRLVYTCQFHPEQDDKGFQDGKKLLRNFFTMTRDYWAGNP